MNNLDPVSVSYWYGACVCSMNDCCCTIECMRVDMSTRTILTGVGVSFSASKIYSEHALAKVRHWDERGGCPVGERSGGGCRHRLSRNPCCQSRDQSLCDSRQDTVSLKSNCMWALASPDEMSIVNIPDWDGWHCLLGFPRWVELFPSCICV